MMAKVSVVIPNWNGTKRLEACLNSLLEQTVDADIIVVDDCSTDDSVELIRAKYPQIELIEKSRNSGFAPTANLGLRRALENGSDFVALLNNDAVADKQWLAELVSALQKDKTLGIATGKILDKDGRRLDSTGECYTIWGLAYPRGRGQKDEGTYDKAELVFGASGGASLYRAAMLKEIGLLDEDFVAYYEDVDLSFRAQLAGWRVAYRPAAQVYHHIGASYGRLKGAAAYHTLKNLPLLFLKNVPPGLKRRVGPRLFLAWCLLIGSALARGQFGPVVKAGLILWVLEPKKWWAGRKIQKQRKVSVSYIDSILVHDLPPGAHRLRKLLGKAQ